MQDGSAAGLGESLFDPETSSLLLGALKDEGIEHSQVRSDSSTIPRNLLVSYRQHWEQTHQTTS